jgi:uncharacterized membrane protein YdbT with pleckstrin-like domain
MPEESVLWEGRPSQFLNLPIFLLCILIVPIPVALWRWLTLRCTSYVLTSERLRITTGVFSRRSEELELYRVKDLTVEQPFLQRLFGLGRLILHTSDRTNPVLVLPGMRDVAGLRDIVRGRVEPLRAAKGVREID